MSLLVVCMFQPKVSYHNGCIGVCLNDIFVRMYINSFVSFALQLQQSAGFYFRATLLVTVCLELLALFAAIGGVTGELLEQNAQALNQISANLQAFQVESYH